jgi:hypothetical protein
LLGTGKHGTEREHERKHAGHDAVAGLGTYPLNDFEFSVWALMSKLHIVFMHTLAPRNLDD